MLKYLDKLFLSSLPTVCRNLQPITFLAQNIYGLFIGHTQIMPLLVRLLIHFSTFNYM